MVRSKRKWKKDSPEKLTARIEKGIAKENAVRLSKLKVKSPDITSPENKKTKGEGKVSTESSSDTFLDTSLIISDSQISVLGNSLNEGSSEIVSDNTSNPPTNLIALNMSNPVENEKGAEKGFVETSVANVTEKQGIEDTLKTITQSLDTLTKSIFAISSTMVSKSDLSTMKTSVDEHEKKIAENTKSLENKMTKEEGGLLRKKIGDHDKILKTQEEYM